ncbi:hypothetical protein AC579_5662 [Pseudocercospora musae]|uniref:PHD-type domain-containing protein n=1 Tax=Pseudocercospora musae TaxID=113226 RepID=A0A139IC30_9PEZI|nr:hypothetical protein AC579_5662 [Pseudocercospora musae]
MHTRKEPGRLLHIKSGKRPETSPSTSTSIMARSKPFRDHSAARRASKVQTLQTQLIASDPRSHVSVSPLTPVTDTDDEALFAVGHRDRNADDEEEGPFTFCTCNTTVEAHDELNLEKMIRCGNRNCEKMWFHLRCVELPNHPPIRLGWMCPECHETYGVTKGLWDFRAKEDDEGGKKVIDAWLREEDREAKKREDARTKKRFWRKEIGESDVDVEMGGGCKGGD